MSGARIVVNDAAFNASLRRAFKRISDRAEDFVDELASNAVDNIRDLAPVKTGRLRAGYRVSRDGRLQRSITTDVEYWAYVEYGTSRMAAQPHVRPGIYRAKSETTFRL